MWRYGGPVRRLQSKTLFNYKAQKYVFIYIFFNLEFFIDLIFYKESPINGYRRFATKKDVFVAHINEFKTSRWCYTCGHEMTYPKKLMYQDGSVYNSFGVLCCSNSNCGITMNRDVNAARNIHHIFSNYLNDFKRPTWLN